MTVTIKPLSLLILLLIPVLTTIHTENISALEYTHNVLVETATSVYCGVCNLEAPKLQSLYESLKGRFIPVNYHFEDEWVSERSRPRALEILQEHNIAVTPTHVFDGDYKETGVISEKWLERAATRPVHRVQLAIEKTIENDTVRYEGSIQELDGHSFMGILRVYIVENGLIAQRREWNFVVRDLGPEWEITLPPNGHTFFSGTWTPTSGHNVHNIMIIASIWERNDQGEFVSIQATNDEYSPPLLTKDTQTPITYASPITSTERTTSHPQQTWNLPFFLAVAFIAAFALTAFFFLYRNKKKLTLA